MAALSNHDHGLGLSMAVIRLPGRGADDRMMYEYEKPGLPAFFFVNEP